MSLYLLPLCLLQALLVSAVAYPENIDVGIVRRQNSGQSACNLVGNFLSFCESVSPGFSTLNPTLQVPCLCYSSTFWVPGVFDNALVTCAAYAKTADVSDYAALTDLEGYCTSVGNVLDGPASGVAASTTPSVATGPRTTSGAGAGSAAGSASGSAAAGTAIPAGCTIFEDIISSCEGATIGFTDLSGSQQASCACYTGSVWNPNGFDGPVSSCAVWAKTADTVDYTDIITLTNFCSNHGDVKSATKSQASVAPIITPSTPPKTTVIAASSPVVPIVTVTQGSSPATPVTQPSSKNSASSTSGSLLMQICGVGLLTMLLSMLVLL